MAEAPTFPLRVVDGLTLPTEYRKALRPGEEWKDAGGHPRQLPRYFYEVPSWDSAMKIELATHFLLWEFIQVDVREAAPLRTFPRYVPCAITLLAVCLERFREAVGALVHISANGGYRSNWRYVPRQPQRDRALQSHRAGDAARGLDTAVRSTDGLCRRSPASRPGLCPVSTTRCEKLTVSPEGRVSKQEAL
jgi:hypothetical protein